MTLFIDNKYTKIYYSIIEYARQPVFDREPYDQYTENHHIIPKCLGGLDKDSNMVRLTGRQHFICHWLLTKMVSEKKHKWQMINALSLMLWGHNNKQNRYKINSRLYEQLKAKHNKMLSERLKGKKRKPFSEEWKRKMTVHLKGNTYGSKAVMVEGVKYISQTEAARKLGYSQAFVFYRLKSNNFPDYYYI
jgi:hypothetical protein